jgi:hypothetical protein
MVFQTLLFDERYDYKLSIVQNLERTPLSVNIFVTLAIE